MFSIKINIILKKFLIFPWNIDKIERIDERMNRKIDTRIKHIHREKNIEKCL